jgi:hypothetical protein
MTATVEFSDVARRMLDDADEQWVRPPGHDQRRVIASATSMSR